MVTMETRSEPTMSSGSVGMVGTGCCSLDALGNSYRMGHNIVLITFLGSVEFTCIMAGAMGFIPIYITYMCNKRERCRREYVGLFLNKSSQYSHI